MTDISSNIRDLVVRHVEAIKAGIAQNMSAKGRTVSGASVNSLLVVPDTKEVGATLMGAPQWAVMQHGRGPGKVPSNFRDIIKDWIQRKGISFASTNPYRSADSQLNSLAYVIARNIMKKGTRLYRDKRYDDIFDSLIDEETEKLANDALGVLSVEVDRINDKRDNV